jgi:hypothetical protein
MSNGFCCPTHDPLLGGSTKMKLSYSNPRTRLAKSCDVRDAAVRSCRRARGQVRKTGTGRAIRDGAADIVYTTACWRLSGQCDGKACFAALALRVWRLRRATALAMADGQFGEASPARARPSAPDRFDPIHAFQTCDFNRSSTSPDGPRAIAIHEAADYKSRLMVTSGKSTRPQL